MAVPMNRSNYAYQFDQTISKMVYGKYADYPKEFPAIAHVENFPDGKTYSEAEISGLGSLRAMGEGEAITFDVPAEGHKKTIQTVKYGLGFQVTEEMSADELFAMSRKIPESLSRSASVCADTNFWNLFNNGFSSELAWDGVAIFGSHTTLKSLSTIANVGSADLSTTSLEAAFEYFDNLVDEAGVKLMIKPNLLVIPTTLKWLANDLLKATGRVWDYSDIAKGLVDDSTSKHFAGDSPLTNPVNPSSGVVDGWKVFVSRYLTDSDAWFLLSPQHDFRFYWKKKPTMASSSDFRTDNMLYKLTMRFAAAAFDYKGAYGSPGA